MEYIAYVETPYKEKFGIPRQSGLAESTCGEIIFTPKFRNPDAVRGICLLYTSPSPRDRG